MFFFPLESIQESWGGGIAFRHANRNKQESRPMGYSGKVDNTQTTFSHIRLFFVRLGQNSSRKKLNIFLKLNKFCQNSSKLAPISHENGKTFLKSPQIDLKLSKNSLKTQRNLGKTQSCESVVTWHTQ